MKRSEFWEHLSDLRKMLLLIISTITLGFFSIFPFHETLLKGVLAPLRFERYLLLAPLDAFFTAIKLSFWTSLVATAPLTLFFLARFLFPALHRKERQLLLLLIPLALLFGGAGVLFAYHITLPLLITFLSRFSTFAEPCWALTSTVQFVLWILGAHALAFQLYALLFLAVHLRLVSYRQLKRARRYAVVSLLILSAFFTPPDVASQLLLACPLLLFYEGTLLYARLRSSPKTVEVDYDAST